MDDFARGFKAAQEAAQRLCLQVGQNRLSNTIAGLKVEDYKLLDRQQPPSERSVP